MRTPRILKSKRGIAIENAVLFILIIFSLCALLATVALTQHYQTKIDKIRLEQEIELEQIGEDFIASLAAGELFDNNYEDYVCIVGPGTLTVTAKSGDSVLLYVKAERQAGGEVNVLAWKPSLPEGEVSEIDQIGTLVNGYLEYLEYFDGDAPNTFEDYFNGNNQEFDQEVYQKYTYEKYSQAFVVRSKESNSVVLVIRKGIEEGNTIIADCQHSEIPEVEVSEIDEIGTAFLEHIKKDTTEVFYPDELAFAKEYEYTVVGNALTVNRDSKTLLYIKTDDDAEILTWRYGEPTEDESKTNQEAAKFLSYSISFDYEKEEWNTAVTVSLIYEGKEFVVNITQGVKISYDDAVLLSIKNVSLNSDPYDMVIFEHNVRVYNFEPSSDTPEQQ